MLMERYKSLTGKGQVALEFMIIAGVAVFFTILLITVITTVSSEKLDKDAFEQLRVLGKDVQHEFSRANQMNNGYERTFEIPEKVKERDFSIALRHEGPDSFIEIGYQGRLLYYDVPQTSGSLVQGNNTIRKDNEGLSLQ